MKKKKFTENGEISLMISLHRKVNSPKMSSSSHNPYRHLLIVQIRLPPLAYLHTLCSGIPGTSSSQYRACPISLMTRSFIDSHFSSDYGLGTDLICRPLATRE